ncbi:glycosyltransferase family 2 protein [Thermococcus sp.]
MLLEVALVVILLWDSYFFIAYLISFLRNYRSKEWTPQVSILIPAYNEAKNIKQAIKSALTQDYPSLEVIVIDDGSEDNTFESANSVRDSRLRVFRKKHEGKAKALNFGLENSTGEIIVTTDADGILDKNAIKELVRRFYSKEVLAVGGQVRVLGRSFLEMAQDVEHLRIAMFRRAKELNELSLVPGPISAFRKRALEEAGGFIESPVEDYATTRAIKKYGRVIYAPKAKVYVKMPKSLRRLWHQRKRWFLGDLEHLGGGFMKDWAFLLIGDLISFLDVIVPPLLIVLSLRLFILWYVFEMLTILVPTLIEGGLPVNVLLFPVITWFWALFYLTLHLYGYLQRFLL